MPAVTRSKKDAGTSLASAPLRTLSITYGGMHSAWQFFFLDSPSRSGVLPLALLASPRSIREPRQRQGSAHQAALSSRAKRRKVNAL